MVSDVNKDFGLKAKDLDPKAKAKDLGLKAKAKDLNAKAKDMGPKDKAKDLDFGLKDQGQGLTSLSMVGANGPTCN